MVLAMAFLAVLPIAFAYTLQFALNNVVGPLVAALTDTPVDIQVSIPIWLVVVWTVVGYALQYTLGDRVALRAVDARVVDAETEPGLHGRIDRVDRHDNMFSLIDYKTGTVPKPADVRAAEEVQLVSYSLLMEHVESVLYLGLDGREGVNDRTHISGDELVALRGQVRDRLVDLMNRIREGAPMPAIGDEATCRHCDAAGICRRKAWQPF
jgi:RecB family exonuclease